MPVVEAKRTLVKSPPELWAELSDPASLSRHLAEFGEIKITRMQAESVVEWEAEEATGRVELEPSGWGTRVTLRVEEPDAAIEDPAPEPDPQPAAAEPQRIGFWARMGRKWRKHPAVEPEPEPVAAEAEPAPEPEPTADTLIVLTHLLDTLGTAHHRPFSRG